jgi:hypothetical protein
MMRDKRIIIPVMGMYFSKKPLKIEEVMLVEAVLPLTHFNVFTSS